MHQHFFLFFFFTTDGHLCNTVGNCGRVPKQQENGIHLHCVGKNTNEVEAMQTFKLQGNGTAIRPGLHEQEECQPHPCPEKMVTFMGYSIVLSGSLFMWDLPSLRTSSERKCRHYSVGVNCYAFKTQT